MKTKCSDSVKHANSIVLLEPLPEWLDSELWDDFISYRKEIKKPMTDTAKKRMLMRLGRFVKAGGHGETIIENSINSGTWSNVYFSVKEDFDKRNERFSRAETGQDVGARRFRTVVGEIRQKYSVAPNRTSDT